jgi:anti-sigma B factor antagonist
MRLADVDFSMTDGVLVAHVFGEIDVSNAGELAAAISERTPNDAVGVVLDLTDVDYLDSGGIHMLYRLRESLRARGQSLAIVVPASSAVIDALRLAGIGRNLELVETLDEGLARVLPRSNDERACSPCSRKLPPGDS